MPDSITPVAAQIQPLNPMQGINTLSGMLGLQQQRQQLASQTAEAQQAQQKNSEMQKAQAIAIQGAQSGKYLNSDGSLNRQKMADDITLVAPTYGQGISNQLLTAANEIVQNKQALQTLNVSQRNQVGATIGALANDPNIDHGKVIDGLASLAHDNPDLTRMTISMGASLPPNASPEDLRQAMRRAALAATGSSGVATGTVDTGPNIQPGVTNPVTGAFTPGGPPITKGLAPTDQPAYKQAAAAASATGSSRASGVASSDIDRANQISGNVKGAQAGIQTTQQVDDLAEQVHSGKFAGWVSKQAAAVGLSESTYARQLLEKDIGILRTQMTSSAPSDSRAATILSGTPDATSDPQTIHGAMDYVRGSFRQNLAQGQNLSAYRAKHSDLSGFQGADDAFTSTGGPLVHEFLSLKTKDQQAAFYRRNFSDPQKALQFRNQAYAASHTLGLDNGNNR